MKLTHIALVAAMTLGLAACKSGQNANEDAKQAPPEAAPDTAAAAAATEEVAKSPAPTGETNWFGGPVYTGEPALAATAALIKAGGGAESFSFATALVSMLGQETVDAEVAKLTKQYGAEEVKGFIDGMTFAVKAAIKRVTAAGITLPDAPADLQGPALAKALVQAGTTPDGTFWAGYMFDKALSHKIHVLVMTDVDGAAGHKADEGTHKILNQAMFDVAQALGMKDVKLASLH